MTTTRNTIQTLVALLRDEHVHLCRARNIAATPEVITEQTAWGMVSEQYASPEPAYYADLYPGRKLQRDQWALDAAIERAQRDMEGAQEIAIIERIERERGKEISVEICEGPPIDFPDTVPGENFDD